MIGAVLSFTERATLSRLSVSRTKFSRASLISRLTQIRVGNEASGRSESDHIPWISSARSPQIAGLLCPESALSAFYSLTSFKRSRTWGPLAT